MEMSPNEAVYQLAHASESRVGELIASTAALTALATVLVIARFGTRLHTKVGLKADDWAILVALVLSWGSFVTNYYGGSQPQLRFGESTLIPLQVDTMAWADI